MVQPLQRKRDADPVSRRRTPIAVKNTRHARPPQPSRSIAWARSMSRFVRPFASWVVSRISNRFQTFDHSGGWFAFSAGSATRVTKPKAAVNNATGKDRVMESRPASWPHQLGRAHGQKEKNE